MKVGQHHAQFGPYKPCTERHVNASELGQGLSLEIDVSVTVQTVQRIFDEVNLQE